jgi:hypothetical protein
MKPTKTHKAHRRTTQYKIRHSPISNLQSPILLNIHTVAGQWHALYAAAKPERRFPKVRAAQLEEQLDNLWSRYRQSIASREADRFQEIGERMFCTL